MTMRSPVSLALAFILGSAVLFGVLLLGMNTAGGDVGSGSAIAIGSGSGSAEGSAEIPDAGSGSAGSGSAAGSASPTEATPAPAIAVPSPATDAGGFMSALASAATGGKWKILAGLVLVGLVYLLRIFGVKVWSWLATGTGGVFLSFATGIGGTVGLVLAAGQPLTLGVFLSAVGTSAAAAGLWQWIATKMPTVDAPIQIAKAVHAAKISTPKEA